MNARFKRYGAALGLSGLAAASHAAVPEGFAAAVTSYGTDTASAIGLLIAAGIVVWGAKKLGQKLGLL